MDGWMEAFVYNLTNIAKFGNHFTFFFFLLSKTAVL